MINYPSLKFPSSCIKNINRSNVDSRTIRKIIMTEKYLAALGVILPVFFNLKSGDASDLCIAVRPVKKHVTQEFLHIEYNNFNYGGTGPFGTGAECPLHRYAQLHTMERLITPRCHI